MAEKILWLFENIHEEAYSHESEKQAMLRAYLRQLFLIIYRIRQHQNDEINTTDEIASKYYRKVKQRIREMGTKFTISNYASELGITPVHLNRICRQIARKSAGQMVQEHLLEEAKKHLIYTQKTIAQVAYLYHLHL